MKFGNYLKDNLASILIFAFGYTINFLIFCAFKVDREVIISSSFISFLCFVFILLIPYFRKQKFYTDLLINIASLDKAYLVLETLTKPDFYEGKLLYQAVYEINKSMSENVSKLEEASQNFKEYIEMWIHEVKIPLASLSLLINNHQENFDRRAKKELKRLENYVDQVLYYARSENAEKDYLIKECSLAKIIKNVGLKNMDDLLENKIDYITENVDVKVLTDSKWLEFILGQIVNNSIKYKKKGNSYIKIKALTTNLNTTLIIKDNGIGIKKSDLKQVFDKSFTGENGRVVSSSTGMGLFIAKNMCDKLGHKIAIESEYNKYTKVLITFAKDTYYDVLN